MLYNLCTSESVLLLRELVKAGWMDTVDVEQPVQADKTPVALLQERIDDRSMSFSIHGDYEKLTLVKSLEQNWHSHVRPAILRLLEAHDQLAPVLAEIIVSYVRK